MIPIALVLAAQLQAPASDTQAAAPSAPAAETFLDRGVKLYWQRRLTLARQEFQKAVDAEPSSAAAHYYLGYTLYKISEPTRRLTPDKQAALEHFGKCFELEPAFKPTWRPK